MPELQHTRWNHPRYLCSIWQLPTNFISKFDARSPIGFLLDT